MKFIMICNLNCTTDKKHWTFDVFRFIETRNGVGFSNQFSSRANTVVGVRQNHINGKCYCLLRQFGSGKICRLLAIA